MATFTFHYHPSKRLGERTGRVFIRVIHARKTKDLKTKYHLFPHEWDEKNRCVLLPPVDHPRFKYVSNVSTGMEEDLQYYNSIVKVLGMYAPYTVEDIVDRLRKKPQEKTVSAFAKRLSNELLENGQHRTARAYITASNSLTEFAKGKETYLHKISHALMKKYIEYLKKTGIKHASIYFHLSNLRAIYNRAIFECIIIPKGKNPFTDLIPAPQQTSNNKKSTLTAKEKQQLSKLEIAL